MAKSSRQKFSAADGEGVGGRGREGWAAAVVNNDKSVGDSSDGVYFSRDAAGGEGRRGDKRPAGKYNTVSIFNAAVLLKRTTVTALLAQQVFSENACPTKSYVISDIPPLPPLPRATSRRCCCLRDD